MPLLPLIAIVIMLIVFRKQLGILKTKYFVALEILSAIWWIWLIIYFLNQNIDGCHPDDGLCNSANTFWGDVSWATMIALLTLPIVWSLSLAIAFLIKSQKKH